MAVATAALYPLVAAGSASAATPPFTQCPAVGYDTSCEILIEAGENGELESFTDPSQGPYDGIEDTLIGVQNNSSRPLTHIKLSGEYIFGFDGDGLCSYIGYEFEGFHASPEGCPFGPTGYEGPNTEFNAANSNEGEVLFTPEGIPPGGSGYFSLEESISGFKCHEDGCKQKKQFEPCHTAVGWGHAGPRGSGGFNEDNVLNVDKEGKEQFEASLPGRSPHIHLSKLAEARCELDEETGTGFFSGAGPARLNGVKGYYVYFEIEVNEGHIYVAVAAYNSIFELVAYYETEMNAKSKQTIG